ncbi:MAG: hypothetical protein GY873_08650 [Bosea sp.]|uniref:hypothetical protein n=1 Tax=Bosea sp. (in: a-proteobacteria) TaxID=1871050 RepID=UPI0023A78D34|nr:hypothetical protein [Bosea sp. (in: a-proteobacteria)]MCP4734248.1 hypothetical protein [Bosea sp. (in: a-proteobacteria)]
MGRFLSSRPAPSDAAPLMALLARGELEEIEAKRQRLMKVIADAKPRRSTILETELKRLTRRALELRVAIQRTGR